MRRNRTKKILLFILLVSLISLIAVFSYLFIYSKMYQLECSRQDDTMIEKLVFEFNTFKNVKKRKKQIVLNFETEQSAIDFYNIGSEETKKISKVEKNKVIFDSEFGEDFVSKNVEEARETSLSWGYTCEMVKK